MVTIFCNPNMVTNIKEVNKQLDFVTNAGVLKTTTKANIPGWGVAWFNPKAITNIFSYSEMAQRYQITYNLSKENVFVVHLPNRQVKFTKTSQGLYAYKPPIKKTLIEIMLINTVAGNRHFSLINNTREQKEQESCIMLLELCCQKTSNK